MSRPPLTTRAWTHHSTGLRALAESAPGPTSPQTTLGYPRPDTRTPPCPPTPPSTTHPILARPESARAASSTSPPPSPTPPQSRRCSRSAVDSHSQPATPTFLRICFCFFWSELFRSRGVPNLKNDHYKNNYAQCTAAMHSNATCPNLTSRARNGQKKAQPPPTSLTRTTTAGGPPGIIMRLSLPPTSHGPRAAPPVPSITADALRRRRSNHGPAAPARHPDGRRGPRSPSPAAPCRPDGR